MIKCLVSQFVFYVSLFSAVKWGYIPSPLCLHVRGEDMMPAYESALCPGKKMMSTLGCGRGEMMWMIWGHWNTIDLFCEAYPTWLSQPSLHLDACSSLQTGLLYLFFFPLCLVTAVHLECTFRNVNMLFSSSESFRGFALMWRLRPWSGSAGLLPGSSRCHGDTEHHHHTWPQQHVQRAADAPQHWQTWSSGWNVLCLLLPQLPWTDKHIRVLQGSVQKVHLSGTLLGLPNPVGFPLGPFALHLSHGTENCVDSGLNSTCSEVQRLVSSAAGSSTQGSHEAHRLCHLLTCCSRCVGFSGHVSPHVVVRWLLWAGDIVSEFETGSQWKEWCGS